MKTTIKLLAVLALLAAAFGQHTTVSAGGGGSFNFRGPSALASFSSVDPSGCISTSVFVIASDAVLQDTPGQPTEATFASVSVFQYDACTGISLLDASGSTSLAEPDFLVGTKLKSATLNTTVRLFDYLSGESFDVSISLNWSASGPLTSQISTSHFHSSACIINTRSVGTLRSAVVSGNISNGRTNFTPEASYDASIWMVRSGNVVIGCQ